ncbi:MAG: A/G-specific adenine glycosylase [Phycisphaerae bacterium]|nr:A/G-specific adenine glycosylase [Phycisphaerae bacterium]
MPHDRRQIQRIRRRLLAWYDRERRDLPWRRRAKDAYAQWVAEIMLQQTRVETVIPYYERFMARFPDADRLARAGHQTVLKHWEGLGYYRRVMHLHDAVRQLRSEGRGVPTSAAELRELPGVGEYTAAAISSIAFHERAAAVDGNVARIICRLFALEDDPKAPAGRDAVRAISMALLSPRRPGDFNQAWMDLGSAVCRPRRPDCPRCPLRSACVAATEGSPEQWPRRAKRKAAPHVSVSVAAIQSGGRMLVRRRPRGGLWSGLWEFPSRECREGGTGIDSLRELLHALGIEPSFIHSPLHVRHQLTHRALDFEVFRCDVCSAAPSESGNRMTQFRWVSPAQFERLPVSTAHRRIHAALSRS